MMGAKPGDRKFVVVIASLAATFALGLVLTFARLQPEVVAHIASMWQLTVGGLVVAFMGANAVEHYSNGKQVGNGLVDTSMDGGKEVAVEGYGAVVNNPSAGPVR